MHDAATQPWYKQFWPWFIIAILLSSMTFSTVYAVMSVATFDGMVVHEDYYKEGKAINQVLAKQARARELHMSASLHVDPVTSDIIVDLSGEDRPETLYMDLVFPTEDDRDLSFALSHVHDGRYVAQAPDNLRYRWYIRLQPAVTEAEWRLTGEARFPTDERVALHPGGRPEQE